ncbi:efflux RND transporter periplasmic adaptor subunit [Lacisediminimonas profundi]|uniref:efflux RND transporter periplasmic adaptor subunit n=1 Tax=Lacisediminimonas profundi TaxID=2603856 RepID=UPI00124B1E2C|nr:efflux RND transporter periplasmic adaptor subunit [Lacisediminimonas profundi]
MKPFPKRFLPVALLVAVVIGGAAWWYLHRQQAERPDALYQFQQVTRGDVSQRVSANGTLNPVTLVNVGTQVSGTVRKLNVDFNDRVQKGQVLLELDPSLLNAQVAQSEASVMNAQAVLDLARVNEARNRTLWEQDSVARQDLDAAVQAHKTARAQLALAQAQLAKDKVNLAYTVIRSPVSGVVVNRSVDVGQTVAASFQTPTLFQIAQDLAKMQADTSFAEADIGSIRVGQAARFNVDAFPERSFVGAVKLIRLNPTTQQNVVTYNVVIAVDNPDQLLLPGMTAYVSIEVAQRKDVVLVPNAALRFKPSGEEVARASSASGTSGAAGAGARRPAETSSGKVYLLDGSSLKPLAVKVGISDGRYSELLGGELRPGDKLAVADRQPNNEQPQGGGTLRFRMF